MSISGHCVQRIINCQSQDILAMHFFTVSHKIKTPFFLSQVLKYLDHCHISRMMLASVINKYTLHAKRTHFSSRTTIYTCEL